jgi:hypothetical protein
VYAFRISPDQNRDGASGQHHELLKKFSSRDESARQNQAELLTDSSQRPDRPGQQLGITRRDEASSALEEGDTKLVIDVRPVHDPRGSLVEESPRNLLGHVPFLAPERRDVQPFDPVSYEDVQVVLLQLLSDRQVVEADELTVEDFYAGGSQGILFPPLPTDSPRGRDGFVVKVSERLEGLEIRPEIAESLAQAGQPVLRAVEGTEALLGIIESISPTRVRRVLQRTGDVPYPPHPGAVFQGTVSTNVLAAVTTKPQSSGSLPSRRAKAGARPSSWLFLPKNQAWAVSLP